MAQLCVERSPVSAWIWRNYSLGSGAFWATIRDHTDGNDISTGGESSHAAVISDTSTGKWKTISRAGLVFDTSSIPADAVIKSAYIDFVSFSPSSNFGGKLRLVSFDPASTSLLVVGDYDQFGTVSLGTEWNLADLVPNFTTFRVDLNSTGLGEITRNGITTIGFRIASDADNVAPTWSSYKSDIGRVYNVGSYNAAFLTVNYQAAPTIESPTAVAPTLTVPDPVASCTTTPVPVGVTIPAITIVRSICRNAVPPALPVGLTIPTPGVSCFTQPLTPIYALPWLVYYVAADHGTATTFYLRQVGDEPINLNNAQSIVLNIYDLDANLVDSVSCTVTDGPNGIISFVLDWNAFPEDGDYRAQIVADWNNGHVLTLPSDSALIFIAGIPTP